MRIGLVTDIHNYAAELAAALELLVCGMADVIVNLGDAIDAFSPAGGDGVAALLAQYGVMGVWGNHDFSLCSQPTENVRQRYSNQVLDIMQKMHPRLELAGCHFSHREASVDPYDAAALWGDLTGEPVCLTTRASQAWKESPALWHFVGHYHRWWATDRRGPFAWNGATPLPLNAEDRYFVVVAAVCDGWCATLDTEDCLLTPHRIA